MAGSRSPDKKQPTADVLDINENHRDMTHMNHTKPTSKSERMKNTRSLHLTHNKYMVYPSLI